MSPRVLPWLIACALLAPGCSERSRTRDIGAPRPAGTSSDPVAWDVSSNDRFGWDPAAFAGMGAAPSTDDAMDTRPVGPAADGGSGLDVSAGMAHGSSGYAWQVPPGWRQQPDRSMRVVTFHAGPEESEGADDVTECYVTQLSGTAGGVKANLDRWRKQMGSGPLTQREYESLPMVRVLGVDAPIVEIEGSYQGMGGQAVDDALLIGAVVPLGDRTLFVKLTGPRSVAAGERDAFLAFCKSLHEEIR